MKKFYWLFLVLVISFYSFFPLLARGYFSMHDDLQIGRLYQLDLCLQDGQIPCRWVPDMGYGYGYPLFNYYPVFPYYLAETFHLLGFSFINSIKILFILGLVFSGIGAYLLGKELWGEEGGLVTAAFYIFAPYHAVDVYVRGALAEFWGLVFFPAVFWAIYQIIKEEKRIYLAVLALFYCFLLLSHNLMAFFFTPVAACWGLFLLWYLKKPLKVLLKLAFGGIWGLGLAAFFVLPVFWEKNLVHIETMFMGYFNYLAHFVSLKQLFFSRFWGYGPSTWGPEDGMAFPIGQLHWLVAIISVIIFVLRSLKKRTKQVFLLAFCFFFFVFFSFLTHLRSTFIWQKMPLLSYMQFPWRFLALATFFTTLMAGSVFALVRNKNMAAILATVMIFMVVVANLFFFHPERILDITDQEKLFTTKSWNKLQTDAIFDYLPNSAEFPPAGAAPETAWFEEGEGEVKDYQRGTNWLKFGLVVNSDQAQVRLPVYYFPRFTIWVDGQPADFDYQNELGLPTFVVSRGAHQIEGRLKNTPVRTISNWLSLFSWIGIIWFVRCRPTKRFLAA